MPTVDSAVRFVSQPETTPEQLRRACRLLALPDDGDSADLRERLLAYLRALAADGDVVCLNPALTSPPSHGKG